ncbi:AraC family transcriptional regulator [Maribacter sp. 2210JD10-5]|uniref:AraC family transcriptional regulator n=1 Tax=Maribacter sp. 2210JD10-5 TaxID=3386272 RepID=UPI0039BCEBD9
MKAILESIPLGQEKTILGFAYEAENFETPWHLHPQHELTYIEESVGTKFVGDYVGPYEPGELVLLRSNLPHCWKNSPQSGGASKSIIIQWNKGVFPKVPELQTIFGLLRNASKGILFNKEEVKPLIPALREIPECSGQECYISLLSLLGKLAGCEQKTLSETSFIDDIPSEHEKRMAKIHEFIAVNFRRKVFLKELAQLVSMSEQSFSRFFSKMMGRPFFVFLNEYRINMAARMLVHTDDTVSQIGFACGYDSLPFFFKKFNQIHKTSPYKYRKQFMTAP